MAVVYVGSARIDEHGNAYGGAAGDQTGGEVATQKWYLHKQGWRAFRAKDPERAKKIAWNMKAACANNHIGYDQYERLSLYNEAKQYGFDCSKVTKNVETDCSALVRVCLAYAGITVDNFRTWNEPNTLLNSGAFYELTGAKYTGQATYLKAGDILVTPTAGHTVVVLNDGDKAATDVYTPSKTEDILDMTMLKVGSKGAEVKTLQRLLNCILGIKLMVDGDFGTATLAAVKLYQSKRNLEVDGVVGNATWTALLKKEN